MKTGWQMKEQINVVVIVGFFGTGKTTFLHHFLTQYPEKKIGVIVNDYGAFHIDDELIENNCVEMREITNGSIFCSCLSDYFQKVLIDFSQQKIDCLLIECSGMADPSNMQGLIAECGERWKRPYRYRGAICILDAERINDDFEGSCIAERQLRCSSIAVVNKSDMIERDDRGRITEMILKVQPEADVFFTSYGRVPYGYLENKLFFNGFTDQSLNRMGTVPEVYSLAAEGEQDIGKVTKFVRDVVSYTARIKGYVNDRKYRYYIEGKGGLFTVRIAEREEFDNTRIVLIGYDDTDFFNETCDAWRKNTRTDFILYD